MTASFLLLPKGTTPQEQTTSIYLHHWVFGLLLLFNYCEQCCIAHLYAGFGVHVDSGFVGCGPGSRITRSYGNVELLGSQAQ